MPEDSQEPASGRHYVIVRVHGEPASGRHYVIVWVLGEPASGRHYRNWHPLG